MVKKCQTKNLLTSNPHLLTLMRSWMMFQDKSELFDHLQDANESEDYKAVHAEKNEAIVRELKQSTLIQDAPEEEADQQLRRLIGILDANAFRINKSGRLLFGLASMLNNSCFPNARVVFGNDLTVTILARTNIHPGEEITITYCSPLLSTLVSGHGAFFARSILGSKREDLKLPQLAF